jgi:hypothetical protein
MKRKEPLLKLIQIKEINIMKGFSWKRALGITGAKNKIARKTGIPTTKAGRKRKIDNMTSLSYWLRKLSK